MKFGNLRTPFPHQFCHYSFCQATRVGVDWLLLDLHLVPWELFCTLFWWEQVKVIFLITNKQNENKGFLSGRVPGVLEGTGIRQGSSKCGKRKWKFWFLRKSKGSTYCVKWEVGLKDILVSKLNFLSSLEHKTENIKNCF